MRWMVDAMKYKIDKSVPIPPPREMFPFAEMKEVGDSFFIPRRDANSLRGALQGAKKRHGFKFTSRSVREGGVDGVRVWRTA